MKRLLLLPALLLLCVLTACTPAAFAAPAVVKDLAHMQVKATLPVWSKDPIVVNFRPNEALCRQTYGENWWDRCYAAPGQFNAPAEGLRMTPAVRGEWRWEDASTLQFVPETPWKPGTTHTVELGGMPLPARARLDTQKLTFTTLPLAAVIDPGEVWIDPSVRGQRAVSFEMRFTSPPDKPTIEKNLRLTSGANDLVLGTRRVVWANEDTTCLVTVPLKSLSAADTVLSMALAGVRQLVPATESEGWKLLEGEVKQRLTVPGKASLFRVTQAELKLKRNTRLENEYQLELKTSLRVPVAQVLKHLKALELPRLQNPEASIPYEWSSAPVISPEDLQKARQLNVTVLRDPGESNEPLVLHVPATPGSHVLFSLPAGFGPEDQMGTESQKRPDRQTGGYTLQAPWTSVFRAGIPEGEVAFLQPGNVLTVSAGQGTNRLDILASGVDEVRYRAQRVRHERMNALPWAGEPFTDTPYPDSLERDADVVSGSIPLPPVSSTELSPHFLSLPVEELMKDGTGLMLVELSGRLNGQEVSTARRMILATNLGLVVKMNAAGERDVFVCSLTTGQPVQGALARIVGRNGLSVAEARTDASGRATLPSVRGLTREKTPQTLVVTTDAVNNNDLAWLPLDDSTRLVDYSRFPTQGQVSAPDNVNAYVFSQRGIYRPGETLFFGVAVRRGDWNALPPGLPLQATLRDPAERVVLRRTFTADAGLSEHSWRSLEQSPTGRYRLDISIPASPSSEDAELSGVILGSGTVRVEEFQPDTLAIRADAPEDMPKGWLVTPPDGQTVALPVNLRDLYGLPAANRVLRGEMSVRPATLSFPGYEHYTFPNIRPFAPVAGDSPATALQETRTSERGEALLPLPLNQFRGGTMLCQVLVEGFEPDGGRAVSTEQTLLVSPLKIMLGYRLTGAVSTLDYVPQGTQGGLELVALDPNLSEITAGPLHVTVAERRYMTTLTTDSQGRYVYEEIPVDTERSGDTVNLVPGKPFAWPLPTGTPGEFLLTVRDADNTVMLREPFTVAGNDDLRPALVEDARQLPGTRLRLNLDKADYAPGETVSLMLASPYMGMGLLTLERDRVATHIWLRIPAGNSVHTLTIPADFEGRGYINVTMGRALSSPDIFLSPHSSALAPLTVNVSGRDMGLTVSSPAVVRPGETLPARITAAKPGKALVFAVDEGVLQLTRFSTPDPLRYLLLDRALEVHTAQLFDLLMPGHEHMVRRLPAFGGDMRTAGGRFHNPFRRKSEPPLSWWSGVVDIPAEGLNLTIPVPDYFNGQVRIMAVGLGQNTAGTAEARTHARAPLVLTPQVPLMAAPGDAFEAGLALRNTTDKPMRIQLALNEQNRFAVTRTLPDNAELGSGQEALLSMGLVAGQTPGNAELVFAATAEDGTLTQRSVNLSLRPATLPMQVQRTGRVPAGQGVTLNTDRQLIPWRAMSSMSVSATPLPPLRGLLRYLADYPYACVEQSLSRSFPLVLLQRRPELTQRLFPQALTTADGKSLQAFTAEAMERALGAIRSGLRERGLARWFDSREADVLTTAYAGDYLLALSESGLAIPGDISTNFFQVLERAVDRAPTSLTMARGQAYGLWVLTRSGRITTQQLDELRSQLDASWPEWKHEVTASLMAGSYAVMNMRAQAEQLLPDNLAGSRAEQAFGMLNPLAAEALHVAVLARQFPDRLKDRAGAFSDRLVEMLNDPAQQSTFTAALSARALLAVADTFPQESLEGFELVCSDPVKNNATSHATATVPLRMDGLLSLEAPGCTSFTLRTPTGAASTASPALYYELTTEGYDLHPPTSTLAQGLEVRRTLTRPDGSEVKSGSEIQQGMVLRAELAVRGHGQGLTGVEVNVVDLLPGGFELVLNHPEDTGAGATNPNDENNQNDDESSAALTRVDRREDRVIVHTTPGVAEQVVVYHLRAVNRGTFTLPAVVAEGMYNRALRAHTAAGTLSVR